MQPVPTMRDPDESEPYCVEAAHDVFQIVDAAGKVVLACGDEANARQYVTLLSDAYRRGYKAGYRKARSG